MYKQNKTPKNHQGFLFCAYYPKLFVSKVWVIQPHIEVTGRGHFSEPGATSVWTSPYRVPIRANMTLRVAQRLQSWISPAAAATLPGAMALMVPDFLNHLYKWPWRTHHGQQVHPDWRITKTKDDAKYFYLLYIFCSVLSRSCFFSAQGSESVRWRMKTEKSLILPQTYLLFFNSFTCSSGPILSIPSSHLPQTNSFGLLVNAKIAVQMNN